MNSGQAKADPETMMSLMRRHGLVPVPVVPAKSAVQQRAIMGTSATAAIVFVAIAGAGLAALAFGRRLPPHHLDEQSRGVVRLVARFLATLSALVLGLLIASAKSNFDEHNS